VRVDRPGVVQHGRPHLHIGGVGARGDRLVHVPQCLLELLPEEADACEQAEGLGPNLLGTVPSLEQGVGVTKRPLRFRLLAKLQQAGADGAQRLAQLGPVIGPPGLHLRVTRQGQGFRRVFLRSDPRPLVQFGEWSCHQLFLHLLQPGLPPQLSIIVSRSVLLKSSPFKARGSPVSRASA
jgi:hypothetical protein